jgi:DnaJ-class molecular chaperone
MLTEDLYKILGVERTASEHEIKKVYRRLARELHPDKNKGNKEAEERFKKVSAAYAVLGNAEKRKLYDRYGIDGLRDGFDPAAWSRAQEFGRRSGGGRTRTGDASEFGGFAGFGGMEEIFEALFGGGGRGQRAGRRVRWAAETPPAAVETRSHMEVDLLDAVIGRELQIVVPVDGERRSLKVSLPRGIESGKCIRLKGQGERGGRGSERGDLIIEIAVRESDVYTRKGMDLIKKEEITVGHAFFGGPLNVETPWGSGKVSIPPGTRGGNRIRIKGHGVRTAQGSGDLYVQINIVLPERRDAATEEAVRRLEALYPGK